MSCKHLSHYTYNDNAWAVASCAARQSPYVPSLKDLDRFCQSGAHVVCPYFLAGRILPAAEQIVLAAVR